MPDMMRAPDSRLRRDGARERVAARRLARIGRVAGGVTGRVFEVEGGVVSVADGWQHGPRADKGARWEPAELGTVVRDLLDRAPSPVPVYGTS